jgi:hypothetical protein
MSARTPILLRQYAAICLVSLGLGRATSALAARPADPIPCSTSRAVESIDRVAAAMLEWLTDVVSGVQAVPDRAVSTCIGSQPVDIALVPQISIADLRALLVPLYIASIPENDPWGTPYEYRLNVANLFSSHAIAVRSAGADRLLEGAIYAVGTTASPEADLVFFNDFRLRQPPRLDPVSRQEATLDEMEKLGWAMLAWKTDVPHAENPSDDPTVDLSLIPPITPADLAALLTPFYIRCVEALDGWGRPYDVRLNQEDWNPPLGAIRSAGADGAVEGNIYDTEIFPAEDFARDLVWSDLQFFQSPSPTRTLIFTDNFESATLWGTWSCGPGF